MKDESEPISSDEFLLRRFHLQHTYSSPPHAIRPGAFEPRVKGNDPDTDGISLYREACLQSPDDILAQLPEAKQAVNGIARLPVTLFTGLGLTLEMKPDVIKGHVVVPEMNVERLVADAGRVFDFQESLATEANKDGNIIKAPVRT